MPHKCTKCESIFKDGAAIILNGCPKCGWNKFLYVREDVVPVEVKPHGELSEPASKFIKEVDELLGKPAEVTALEKAQPEVEKPRETQSKEIGNRVESVRILAPGTYELNLESLLERDEIVMALKEDGTYIVHLPSVFNKKKFHER
jgi:predicted  nucleic acid-binding Zn-ribbon protein